MTERRQETAGRGWARTGATAGAVISIAGNVLHTLIPPADPPPADWHPQLGAVIGAVWWPVSLFLALEVLVSARWGSSWEWVLVRLGTVVPVAAVAAVVSYHHLAALLTYYQEDSFTVQFGPVAVDGLMVLCSAALYRIRITAAEVATAAAAAESWTSAPPVADVHPIAPPATAAGPAAPGGRVGVLAGARPPATPQAPDGPATPPAGPSGHNGGHLVHGPVQGVHPAPLSTRVDAAPSGRPGASRGGPAPGSSAPQSQDGPVTPGPDRPVLNVHPSTCPASTPGQDTWQDAGQQDSTPAGQLDDAASSDGRTASGRTAGRAPSPGKAADVRDIMAELGVSRSRAYALADDPAALARVRAARAHLNGHAPVGTP